MILEVLIYGLALAWLIGVVPAAVITIVKGRWLYFWCGWLTLGIVWFVGALAPKPDSPPRDRGRVACVLGGTVALVLALGLLGARPSPVLGLDGEALQGSVGNEVLYDSDSCQPEPDGGWICSRYDDGFSSTVSYVVHANGLGCWHAVRVGRRDGEGSPKRISGCVTLYNFVLG